MLKNVVAFFRNVSTLQARASLLAYYTLYALVPLFTYFLAISHIFFKNEEITKFFLEHFKLQKAVFSWLFDLAASASEAISHGPFAYFAIILFFPSILVIINNLEEVFDGILKVEKRRNFARKLKFYPVLLILLPSLAIFASSLDFYFAAIFAALRLNSELFLAFEFFLLRILPYLLIVLLFYTSYSLIPSKSPPWKPTLYASFFSAIFNVIFQWAFAYYQFWSISHNIVYGAFTIIPLFLIWLELSWLNLLFGAKVLVYLQEKFHKNPRLGRMG